jgi:hypothetical protein
VGIIGPPETLLTIHHQRVALPLADGVPVPGGVGIAIGAVGMGEVYRAKETILDREVAIKVLPVAVAEDPERLVR